MIAAAVLLAVLGQVPGGPMSRPPDAPSEVAAEVDAGSAPGVDPTTRVDQTSLADAGASAGAGALSDAGTGQSAQAPSPGVDAGTRELGEFAPTESASSASAPSPSATAVDSLPPLVPTSEGFKTEVFALLDARFGVDTRFEPRPPDAFPENVVDGRLRARLGAEVQLSEHWRVHAEARADWRAGAQAGFARPRATFDPLLGETYLDGYFPALDLRIGTQLIPLGANAFFAPADVLNPRDLTQSLLQGEPEDARLPIFAVRAQGELGPVRWLAAYAPFFTPDRFTLFGQDESLLQPGWGTAVPTNPIDPSVEDLLQPRLTETQRPQPFGIFGDLALQATVELGGMRLGASWVWAWEKLPQVALDPELRTLLVDAGRNQEPSPALLLSVEDRLRAGETLYRGVYDRQHVFSLQASRLVGPVQLDVDVGYSPGQTFADDDFQSVRKRALTWVVGLTPAEDSPWVYALSYVGVAAFQVHADELLALIEPATARGAERTAYLHLITGQLTRKLLDDRLELQLRAAFEPIQRSYAVAPRVCYRLTEGLWLWVGAEVYGGPVLSPLGYFGRNDQVLAGVRWQR